MPETWTNVALVGPHAGMFDAWFRLYEHYATAAGAAPNRRTGGMLWRWLLDGTYRVAGVMAVDSRKEIIGFAHFRPYPNTLTGSEACWIDDIYVADDQRDSGLLERLVGSVCDTARKRGWSEVVWIGGNDTQARAIYDRIAVRRDVATYRIAVGG